MFISLSFCVIMPNFELILVSIGLVVTELRFHKSNMSTTNMNTYAALLSRKIPMLEYSVAFNGLRIPVWGMKPKNFSLLHFSQIRPLP